MRARSAGNGYASIESECNRHNGNNCIRTVPQKAHDDEHNPRNYMRKRQKRFSRNGHTQQVLPPNVIANASENEAKDHSP